jgi:hypothetical protein
LWVGGQVGHGTKVAAVWLWSVRNKWGHSDLDPADLDVYISDHAIDGARDLGLSKEDIVAEMKAAPGRYNAFKYTWQYGRHVGWWNPESEIFVGSTFTDDGKALVVTTVFDARRAYVDRLIKEGWK